MGPGREVQAHSFPIGGQSDQEFVAAGPEHDAEKYERFSDDILF
jgi:hypothetical protein